MYARDLLQNKIGAEGRVRTAISGVVASALPVVRPPRKASPVLSRN
jgi:hypothetical protein